MKIGKRRRGSVKILTENPRINEKIKVKASENLKMLTILLMVVALSGLFIASSSTYSVYGLNKLTDVDEDAINNPERATTINKIVNIFKFSLAFTFIFSLILGFSVNILTLPLLLFPIFMGIVYSVRLSHHLPRLKDI